MRLNHEKKKSAGLSWKTSLWKNSIHDGIGCMPDYCVKNHCLFCIFIVISGNNWEMIVLRFTSKTIHVLKPDVMWNIRPDVLRILTSRDMLVPQWIHSKSHSYIKTGHTKAINYSLCNVLTTIYSSLIRVPVFLWWNLKREIDFIGGINIFKGF